MGDAKQLFKFEIGECAVLLVWFMFNNEASAFDRDIAEKLNEAVQLMARSPEKYDFIIMSTKELKQIFRWFDECPRSLVDQCDIDVFHKIVAFKNSIDRGVGQPGGPLNQ